MTAINRENCENTSALSMDLKGIRSSMAPRAARRFVVDDIACNTAYADEAPYSAPRKAPLFVADANVPIQAQQPFGPLDIAPPDRAKWRKQARFESHPRLHYFVEGFVMALSAASNWRSCFIRS